MTYSTKPLTKWYQCPCKIPGADGSNTPCPERGNKQHIMDHAKRVHGETLPRPESGIWNWWEVIRRV